MTRARRLLLPVLIVGLVALAAFGVRQLIVDDEGPGLVVAIDDRALARIGWNSAITVVDPLSGTTLGEINGGYRPWVLLRPSRGQILVAQLLGPGSTTTPLLRIFDIEDLTSPSVTIPLPDRGAEVIYSPRMVLSGDEQLLYYVKVGWICPEGGDAALCGTSTIGVVDLEKYVEVAAAEIPLVGCGFPKLIPLGDTDALALCGHQTILTLFNVTPQGTATEVASFPTRDTGAVTMGVTGDGTYYVVYFDGVVLTADSNSATIDYLPSDDIRAGFSAWSTFGSDRFLFAYGAGASPPYDGMIIFSRADPTDFENVEFPFPVAGVAPIDASRVAILKSDSPQLSILDLRTGEIVGSDLPVPEGVRWLVGN